MQVPEQKLYSLGQGTITTSVSTILSSLRTSRSRWPNPNRFFFPFVSFRPKELHTTIPVSRTRHGDGEFASARHVDRCVAWVLLVAQVPPLAFRQASTPCHPSYSYVSLRISESDVHGGSLMKRILKLWTDGILHLPTSLKFDIAAIVTLHIPMRSISPNEFPRCILLLVYWNSELGMLQF